MTFLQKRTKALRKIRKLHLSRHCFTIFYQHFLQFLSLPVVIICVTLRIAEEMAVTLLGPGKAIEGLVSALAVLLVTSPCDFVPPSCVVPECSTISCASPPKRLAILRDITCKKKCK